MFPMKRSPPKQHKLVFRLTRIDKLNNLVSNLIIDDWFCLERLWVHPKKRIKFSKAGSHTRRNAYQATGSFFLVVCCWPLAAGGTQPGERGWLEY